MAADIKLLGYPEDNKIKLLKAYRTLKPGMALMEVIMVLHYLLNIVVQEVC